MQQFCSNATDYIDQMKTRENITKFSKSNSGIFKKMTGKKIEAEVKKRICNIDYFLVQLK